MNGTAVKRSQMEFEVPGISPGDAREGNWEVLAPRNEKLEVLNYLSGNHREEMVKDIRRGMMKTQKSIPAKYFYDARGSQLFDQICATPEYYLTETELSILDRSAAGIMQFFSRAEGDLIELGCGSNRKIRTLLDVVHPLEHGRIRYVPVDISKSCLFESARELLDDYENLAILGVLADFTQHMGVLPRGRKLITFFGSTIGNLTEMEAVNLLKNIRTIMSRDDRFLLGMDMLKPVEILEAAYNDRQGVTCDFNRNILVHIDRELKANFDPKDFEHLAFFNPGMECVEMHLKASRKVAAHIADLGLSVQIEEGETIHTEICKKFSRQSAERLFRKAGLSVSRWFTDSKDWFSLVELRLNGTE